MIDCKSIVAEIKEELKEQIKGLRITPHLCVIQVGDNPASNAYIRGKGKDCEEVGIKFTHIKLDENIKKYALIEEVRKLVVTFNYSHMMVQLPIPFSKEDTQEILESIPGYMDVDGLTWGSDYTPCTPLGVMKILEKINYDLEGKRVVIINRSDLVGKPLINLMLEKNATPIVCHSHTRDLDQLIGIADVIITAVGKKDFLNIENVNPHQCIIDVGITRDENGKICGDCSKELYDIVDLITPTPGGTGLFTRLMLLENIITSLEED